MAPLDSPPHMAPPSGPGGMRPGSMDSSRPGSMQGGVPMQGGGGGGRGMMSMQHGQPMIPGVPLGADDWPPQPPQQQQQQLPGMMPPPAGHGPMMGMPRGQGPPPPMHGAHAGQYAGGELRLR